MRGILRIYTVVGLVLIINALPCFPTDRNTQNEESEHLVSAQAIQPQGPVKEPQKIEAPQKVEQPALDQSKLNLELMNSIFMGNAKRVEELVSQGADCNVNFRGLIPLHLAIQRGHKDIAVFLINSTVISSRSLLAC